MAELDRAAISLRMGQSRDTAGLTQPEIAELLSVHFRSIQDWESPKKHVVPFDRLDEWARLTSTTREWLLYGEEADSDDRLEAIEAELRQVRGRLEAVDGLLRELDQLPALIRALLAVLERHEDTG